MHDRGENTDVEPSEDEIAARTELAGWILELSPADER